MSLINKIFGSYETKELKKIEPIKKAVLNLESKYRAMSEEELIKNGIIIQQYEDEDGVDCGHKYGEYEKENTGAWEPGGGWCPVAQAVGVWGEAPWADCALWQWKLM